MADDRLSITLNPKAGYGIPLDKLGEALRGLDDLLSAITEEQGASVSWVIDEMHVSDDGATSVTVKGVAR